MKVGVALSKTVKLLRKFTKWLVAPPANNKPVKVAKNAVPVTRTQTQTTQCGICMEKRTVDQMFTIQICGHSYCLSCMSKQVEYMLHQARLPKCPHDKCMSQLRLKGCKKFLSSNLLELMRHRLHEANIPAAERFYCPNPTCSALFPKRQFQGRPKSDGVERFISKKCCPKCKLFFCIDCKVLWHENLECHEYSKRGRNPEDCMFKSLASKNSWRQCPMCNHMVSLGSGCYHIYCRCRHEFCYKCGAAWKDKKATCKCPVWDERNTERRRR